MKPIATFKVRPSLPEALQPLLRIAYNLRWSWDAGAVQLFLRLDRDLWETTGHNPVLLLGSVDQSVLEAAARDDSFLAHLQGVVAKLDAYSSGEGTWYRREHKQDGMTVAYFSAEFGLTECLSIFAGGLGVLAGDHLKAASDLGLPLVGVGLAYQQGYFRQYLNAAGWQQEAFEDNDFHTLPIQLVPGVKIEVELPEGPVAAQVWSVDVGRLKLYLLDTNIPQNKPEYRKITHHLYGGGLEMRIQQEILLGVGGYRALEALGLHPTVYHMNEGHSAFLGVERIQRLMESKGLSFREARLLASASLVFTSHTPVAAGHDYFPPALMDRYFSAVIRRLGINRSEFLALGRKNPGNEAEDFCMTVLALRLASFSNGVSQLHGSVTRRMWNEIWKGVPESEVPIGHVTNGVHFRSWVSFEMNQLYDRYLGPKWREEPADHALWQRVEAIPAAELWRTHERRRERLVAYARQRLRAQLVSRGAAQSALDEADEVLNPDALTIGFGRRFAAYKRANLLIRDPERLARLLNHPQRPVQIIFAGKAHPQDSGGKQLIQNIVNLAGRPEFRRKIVFLENYDMAIARYMVQGSDVWLNTPLRPMEASGTSGMKAQANGVINVSTLDGWWDEAWRFRGDNGGDVGWAIGHGENYEDLAHQDQVEADALYELLERQIVPMFYERRSDGMPPKWIGLMKTSIAKLCPEFNMHRMVKQYAEAYYKVTHTRYLTLNGEDSARVRRLSNWLAKVDAAWPALRLDPVPNAVSEIRLGDQIQLSARVTLNDLTPEDVLVQVVAGSIDAAGAIMNPVTISMQPSGRDGSAEVFQAALRPSTKTGLHGYSIRILPKHPDLISAVLPGLITWAN
ncbi:MAG: alpha-glucan family phosphorylase [Acidobacteriia bacterium]|nr:alpha-glucan family phosphorylase [Terriglobia bacterium]